MVDAVLISTAMLISIFVDFLWLAVVDDRPIPHQLLAADLLQENAHSVCLLVLISLGVYAWSGLYSSSRSYRRYDKARVIARAVTVSYLLFIVFDFIFPSAIQLPPVTLVVACA
jgi:succinate dehydrogenase hydrophobic anchor subunit